MIDTETDIVDDVIYIAGPMTGLPDYNYPAFHQAAAMWRAHGWEVRNPAEAFNGDQTLKYTSYMRSAIGLVYQCRAVALLPNWQTSRGARLEVLIAQRMGYEFYNAITGQFIDNLPPLDAQ